MKDNMDVNTGGAKFDSGKLRVDLVPAEFIMATAATLTYGAIKYDEWNWAKGLRKGRLMAALMRHWLAFMVKQECDPESGLPHTWHMAACLAMLIASEARGTATDDRQEAQEGYQTILDQYSMMEDPTESLTKVDVA
jgi:hypothetical protein